VDAFISDVLPKRDALLYASRKVNASARGIVNVSNEPVEASPEPAVRPFIEQSSAKRDVC
jgi:hypothetical protein